MATTQPHHKKISRKELKQPDEFQSFVGNAQEFIINNLQQVIVSVSIVIAAGALAVGIYYYEIHRDNVAGDRFYSAVSELNNKNYLKAETDFAKLAEDEPGREVGKLSRFYLASVYLNEGQLPKARDALVAYIPDAKDDLFASVAYEDLGVVYEKMGDFKKAQGAYAQAAAITGPEQNRAELQVARMLTKQGDKTGAIAAYQRFLVARPFSQERQTVIEAMAELGATPAEATPAHATSMPKPQAR
jgi:tetratricopeptide (TPR) repeat protein